MVFKNKKNEEKSFLSITDLFSTDKNVRNDFFGSYLSDKKDPSASVVIEKIDDKVSTYSRILSNLQTLRKELTQLASDEEARKLQGTIDGMSVEQAQALMEKLQSRLSA